MTTQAKTEVRLSRDAKIPRHAKVTIDLVLTYEVPWEDALLNLGEDEASLNEYLDDLATAYGRHTPLAHIAAREGWDLLADSNSETFTVNLPREDGAYPEDDIEVEQDWENDYRKRGRPVPVNREYREILT